VESDKMPKEYGNLTDWQTKDVVEPSLETLIINKNGRLKLHPGYPQNIYSQGVDVNFHGDMNFYTADKNNKLVEMVARFTDGNLEWIKIKPNEKLIKDKKSNSLKFQHPKLEGHQAYSYQACIYCNSESYEWNSIAESENVYAVEVKCSECGGIFIVFHNNKTRNEWITDNDRALMYGEPDILFWKSTTVYMCAKCGGELKIYGFITSNKTIFKCLDCGAVEECTDTTSA
jgi:DNA-directed RNA polymerase subunit RPC12/RpoP